MDKDLTLGSRIEEFSKVVSAGRFTDSIGDELDVQAGVKQFLDKLKQAKESDNRIFIVGNGGSAGVASHVVTDFVNKGELSAFTLHDPALLTCMANDYGYENAFARILSTLAHKGDILIAISSSGQSVNIHNAIQLMQKIGGTTISLSGFKKNNPLRSLGSLNFWLDSNDYGFVEMGHFFLLHYIADRVTSVK
jgi:D-sedoheptulose 7-phosphate isomerase